MSHHRTAHGTAAVSTNAVTASVKFIDSNSNKSDRVIHHIYLQCLVGWDLPEANKKIITPGVYRLQKFYW